MKRFINFFFAFLFLTTQAQDKLLTIEDAVIGQWREYYPTTMNNIQWKGETNTYTFQDYTTLYSHNTSSLDTVTLLTLKQLNTVLQKAGLDSLRYLPYIQWINADQFDFQTNTAWILFNIKYKTIQNAIKFPEKAENITLCSDHQKLAYTLDNNLFVTDTKNETTQITNDNNPEIIYGQFVSRNEFGIDGGIFWSPKGNYLAFYRKDESKVGNYPLVDITKREAKLDNIKYPMAGMPSEHISIGIYNFQNGATNYIEKDDTLSEKYLTNVSWDPQETSIYVQVLNRDQNHMKLNAYDLSGNLVKTLFEEKNDRYVEPSHPILFLPGKNNQFVYQTRNNGFNHAYLYDTNGNLIKQLTQGSWEITEIIDLDNKNIYYMSTAQSPIERHFYKTSIKSGKTKKITIDKGSHSIVLNPNKKYFIDRFSSTTIPNQIQIMDTQGNRKQLVLKADNPLKDVNMPDMEIGTLKAADGQTDLYYRLIKPINFDPDKKYPAIVYVYGGPHAQLINDRWLGGARMWNYFMAQKGYVMLTVDNRGSSNRGLEFENIIHRQCGVNEMKDQMEGIKLLENLGFVDMNRIGVHGWSYGGFMTISLMLNYPDVFKVGVAGGPVIDWKYYEVMYGERYMDTPEQNPEGYQFTSLIPRAKDLKGKLLIIHGGIDPVVVNQHSQLFLRECIKNHIPIDYFTYPRAEHNVRGYDRIHLMDKVTHYFDDYLK